MGAVQEKRNWKAHLREILDGLPDAILVTDDCGTIVWVNSQVENLFGYEPGELIDVSVEKLVAPRHRTAHVKHRAAYFSSPTPRQMGTGILLHGRRKDGSEFPVDVSLNPLQVGNRVFVTSTVRDISDWRTIEAHLRAVQQMTRTVIGIIERAGHSAKQADGMSARNVKSLSTRERGILRLLSEGKGNKEISRILGISTKTVEAHRARIMLKLDVSSLAGLIRYAIHNEMAEP